MPLTISAARSTSPQKSRHRRLVADVLAELSSWKPRDFIVAFKRWHQGSLSLIHLNVLTLLESEGPMSMSRLAEALDVSVASMTGIVDRMVKRGLVDRRHDDDDRRVVLVSPTDAGGHVFQEIDQRRREGMSAILERLSDVELAGLLKGHRALRAARAAVAAPHSEATAQPGPATPLPPARTGGARR